MPRILLVSGSGRSGSTNVATLRTATAIAPSDVETSSFGGLDALPLFNPDADREGIALDPRVTDLRTAIADADAVLICTPEYAGALPAAMKNLLEWTIGNGGIYGKPVAWINAAGPAAPTGAADAHESLRKVLRYAGAEIVDPACARIPIARDMVGPDGLVNDPAARDSIQAAVRTLVDHIRSRPSDG